MPHCARPALSVLTAAFLTTVPTAGVAQTDAPGCPDLTTFIRQFLDELPVDLKVPRGAFVLAHDGRVTCTYGFGKTAAADVVDPARSIFRAASNSKLVTATAVMQLVDTGRWRLTDDVNRYLPEAARLQVTPLHPVTLEHLLTHTGGFEDKFEGAIATPDRRLTLPEYFVRHRPRVVTQPGAEVSYSNAGIALAGLLVEAVSGEPFEHYAERAIFRPLGMTRSTFEQPVPEAWSRDVAAGLSRGARRIVFNPYPAASLSTTPIDMGRFIAAHLHGGALQDGGRILSVAIEREMLLPRWRAQPSVPAVALGFFEGLENGRRTLFHTGDSGDHSVVFILPEERVGFYFVYTGEDAQSALRERFTRAFLDRFYPLAAAVVRGAPRSLTPVTDLAPLAGTYRNTQHSRSNYEKLKALFNQVRIRTAGDGRLEVTPPGASSPLALKETDHLVFRAESGEVVAFRAGAYGRIVGFTLAGFIWDPSSWDRLRPLEDGRLHLVLFGSIGLVFLTRVVGWTVASWFRRLRRAPMPARTVTERRWWRWSGIVSGWMLLAPIAAIGTAFLSFQHPAIAGPRAAAVLSLGLSVGICAGLALGPVAVLSWKRGLWSLAGRVQFSLTATAFAVAAPLFVYWRLLHLPW